MQTPLRATPRIRIVSLVTQPEYRNVQPCDKVLTSSGRVLLVNAHCSGGAKLVTITSIQAFEAQ